MKKLIFSALLLAGAATINNVNAQLPNGSIAPNFTVTDINGQSHTLYDYLDNGYTVVIDLNATWCGPCWSYHQGGALEDLWTNHGPTGGNGVSASTTDDVVVFMIESDASTTNADLVGTGSNTYGDWTAGTNFFIVDDASVASAYALAYYPTIYTICPNRILEETGQQSATAHYSDAAVCPVANGANNPALIAYNGETSGCDQLDVDVTMQNMGTANLTSATIELKLGATTINTLPWTGNLATYEMEVVTVGSVTPTSGSQNYTVVITSPDDNASDNSLSQSISGATPGTGDIAFALTLDNYPTETTWDFKNSTGSTVQSGGPYTSGDANQVKNYTLPVTSNECYSLTLYDAYGDGLGSAQWGGTDGSWTLTDALGSTIASGSGDFGDDNTDKMDMSVATGLEESGINELSIFPNPFNNIATISFNVEGMERTTVELINTIGQTVQAIDLGLVTGTQLVELNAIELPSGFYLVNIKSGSNTVVSRVTVNK